MTSVSEMNNSEFEGKYVLVDKIGRGTFSDVYKAYKNGTLEKYAVKITKKPGNLEYKILSEILDHPNIPRVYNRYMISDKEYIVMDYVKGTNLMLIFETLRKRVPFEISLVSRIFRKLVDIVSHLHQRNIVHKDLKMGNIIVIHNEGKMYKNNNDCVNTVFCENIMKNFQELYLIDFNLSIIDKDEMIISDNGSLGFMAPELIKQEPHLPKPTDIWSLGIILYMLTYQKWPFYGSMKETKNAITIRDPKYDTETESLKVVNSLIRWMLEKDPTKRPTIEQVSKHEFIYTKTD